MNRAHFGFAALLACCGMHLVTTNDCQAAFHLWKFTEFFSNADGSVQFIEMFDPSDLEQGLGGKTIVSTSTGKMFTFPANLTTTDTDHRNLLIATAGFGALSGAVTPDFDLPSTSFFNPAGDTLTFSGSLTATTTFPSVPTDGVQSRNYPTNTLANNTPTNFNHDAGFINLSTPPNNGDYNGDLTVDAADYTVWRNTLGMSVAKSSGADGNNNSLIDGGDYTFWKQHYGQMVGGAGASLPSIAVPEPTAFLLSVAVMVCLAPRRRNRSTRLAAIGR